VVVDEQSSDHGRLRLRPHRHGTKTKTSKHFPNQK
jgi:hypothetical protein